MLIDLRCLYFIRVGADGVVSEDREAYLLGRKKIDFDSGKESQHNAETS
jgi:hypothetical protein